MTTTKHRIKSTFLFCLLALNSIASALAGALPDTPAPDAPQDTRIESYQPSPESGLSVWHKESGGAGMLFFGTRHNFDPASAQRTELTRLFEQFAPTLLIVEGGAWPVATSADEAVRKYGEMGLVTFLAAKRGIRVASFDADFHAELLVVSQQFPAEVVKTYYVARLVPQLKAASGTTPSAAEIEKLLRSSDYSSTGDSSQAPATIDAFDRSVRSAVPGLKDWTALEYEHVAGIDRFNPEHKEMLNRVATASQKFRDQTLADLLLQALHNNDRVVVVAGLSHMLGVMQLVDIDAAFLK